MPLVRTTVILCGMLVVVDAAWAGPKLKCDEATYDYGTVWVGPPVKHTFTVKNEGDEPLLITGVKAGCPCITVAEYDKEIAPGKTGRMTLLLNTHKVGGHATKTRTLSTNDPDHERLTLGFCGTVKHYIQVNPLGGCAFGKVSSDQPTTKTITITNNTGQELKLEPANELKHFKYELVPDEKGSVFQFKVTAAPPFDPGSTSETAVFKTNYPKVPEVQIKCTYYSPPRLEVRPPKIVIDRLLEADATRVVRFVNNGKTPIEAGKVTVEDPKLSATIKPGQKPNSFEIRLNIPAGYRPPPEGTALLIHTNDKEQPIITVPIKRSLRD